MTQQEPTVTPVRVYTEVGTDRDLTLGTERVTRKRMVEFRVEGGGNERLA